MPLESRYRPDKRPPLLPKLTSRDRQLARLVYAGFRAREIGLMMGLTTPTVRSMLYKLFQKLEVHSREELARLVDANWPWFEFAFKADLNRKFLIGMKRVTPWERPVGGSRPTSP